MVKDYYTTSEAARLLSVSADTVLKWVKADKIDSYRTPGGHARIPKAAVDAIKFTLDNTKKKEVPVSVTAEAEVVSVSPTAAKAIEVKPTAISESPQAAETDIQPMTAEEMREMIARAKEGQADDDCLMCGS